VNLAEVIRAVEGPIANVQSAPPESITYRGNAASLQEVWIAVRASLRQVLESVTLDQIVSGDLPEEVTSLARPDDAWVTRRSLP
jgi:DNA-binding IscR family transcriptional regulator